MTGGKVRVGGTPAMCAGILVHVLAATEEDFPGVRYEVVERDSDGLVAALRSRSVDIAVGREPESEAADDVSFEPLFEDRLFAVVGARHRLARASKVVPQSLDSERWALPPRGTQVGARLAEAFSRLGVPVPQAAVSTMSMPVRYRLLESGRFVTVLYGSLLRFGSVPAGLRVLPIELPVGVMIGILRIRSRSTAPIVERLAAGLSAAARTLQSVSSLQLQRMLERSEIPLANRA
jgi:DNA-binding transcriptional LysR family regulator